VLPDTKKGSICLKEEEALQLLPFFNLKVLVRYGVPLLKEANEMWFISDWLISLAEKSQFGYPTIYFWEELIVLVYYYHLRNFAAAGSYSRWNLLCAASLTTVWFSFSFMLQDIFYCYVILGFSLLMLMTPECQYCSSIPILHSDGFCVFFHV